MRPRPILTTSLFLIIVATCVLSITNSVLISRSSGVAAVVATAPLIQAITPSSGGPGTSVTITGTNFSNLQSITFAGYSLTQANQAPSLGSGATGGMTAQPEDQISGNSITFTVPASFATGTVTHDLSTGTYPNVI